MSKRIAFGPIYRPAALAGEYGEWALNIYTGCPHHCTYCYVPGVLHTSREVWQGQPVMPRVTPEQVSRASRRMRDKGTQGRVFLCFTCDPYGAPDEHDITRSVIDAITSEGLGVTVLTKAGEIAKRDMDLLERNGSQFWITLTTMNEETARQREPGAASPARRLMNLIVARNNHGISTAVSLEPVISPAEGLEVIQAAGPFAETIHVGKINHHAGSESVDWRKFCKDATDVAKDVGASLKFKSSLWPYLEAGRG